jgi:hypothetical protein
MTQRYGRLMGTHSRDALEQLQILLIVSISDWAPQIEHRRLYARWRFIHIGFPEVPMSGVGMRSQCCLAPGMKAYRFRFCHVQMPARALRGCVLGAHPVEHCARSSGVGPLNDTNDATKERKTMFFSTEFCNSGKVILP